MSTYQPISCDLYDWLEIAASWQLPVTLTGRDGRQWEDKIRTIEARAGVEYLLLVALLYSPGIFIYWKARQHHGLRGLNRLEQGMTAALLGCAVLAFYKVMDGTIPLS